MTKSFVRLGEHNLLGDLRTFIEEGPTHLELGEDVRLSFYVV